MFCQLRSAYAGNNFTSWSDILAVILFDWFPPPPPPTTSSNNNNKDNKHKKLMTTTTKQHRKKVHSVRVCVCVCVCVCVRQVFAGRALVLCSRENYFCVSDQLQ